MRVCLWPEVDVWRRSEFLWNQRDFSRAGEVAADSLVPQLDRFLLCSNCCAGTDPAADALCTQ